MFIALFDVKYDDVMQTAKAAGIIVNSWESQNVIESHTIDVVNINEYEPGKFCKRELPCIFNVFKMFSIEPDIIVVDGYAMLPGNIFGLGAHLYNLLNSKIPIIGIAKTAYKDSINDKNIVPIFRGKSNKQLYVSAIGIDVKYAAISVMKMAGDSRLPTLVKLVDKLTRVS